MGYVILLGLAALGSTGAGESATDKAAPIVLYVAPEGNNAWSGRRPAPNPAKTDGPFATLERARDAVRDLKRRQDGALRQPVTVRVRGGTYRLAEPLLLTPEDSGTADCPITYEAHTQETPVFSGGRHITGWKEAQVEGKPLWVAELPDVRAGKWYF